MKASHRSTRARTFFGVLGVLALCALGACYANRAASPGDETRQIALAPLDSPGYHVRNRFLAVCVIAPTHYDQCKVENQPFMRSGPRQRASMNAEGVLELAVWSELEEVEIECSRGFSRSISRTLPILLLRRMGSLNESGFPFAPPLIHVAGPDEDAAAPARWDNLHAEVCEAPEGYRLEIMCEPRHWAALRALDLGAEGVGQ